MEQKVMDEWQLVTRKRRHGKSPVASAAKVKTQGNAYRYKVASTAVSSTVHTNTNTAISDEKRVSIQERVARIAADLRESASIQETLLLIKKQFAASDITSEEEATAGSSLTIVGYGLGSFSSSTNAVYQLAFLRALVDAIKADGDASGAITCEVFDPVMTESDAKIVQHFDITVLDKNESGKRQIQTKTVFFMPHCGMILYQNVLASNWGPALHNAVIIGNSFEAYSDRLIDSALRKKSVLVGMLPYLIEVPLANVVSKSHDEFVHYEAAFNDTSIHVFPLDRVASALTNESLAQCMRTAVQAQTDGRDSGEETLASAELIA